MQKSKEISHTVQPSYSEYVMCVSVGFFLRCRDLLWLVYPWSGEARLGSTKEQGSSRHWAETVGGLPREGCVYAVNMQVLHPHVFILIPISLSSWDQTLAWQGSPSPWRTWPCSQLLALSFDLGESDASHLFSPDTTETNDLFTSNMASFCVLQLVCRALP